MILCIDGETTGIDPQKDALLEIALVVAKDDLTVVGQYSTILPQSKPVQRLFNGCKEKVQKMHTDNGLWLELWQQEQLPLEQRKSAIVIMQEIMAFLAPFGLGQNAKVPAFGRNPGFDLSFCSVHLPLVADCFTYQKIDTTSFQLRVMAKYGNQYKFELPAGQRHRALDDALAAIEEQKYYETNFMR